MKPLSFCLRPIVTFDPVGPIRHPLVPQLSRSTRLVQSIHSHPIVAFDPIGPVCPLAPNRRIRPDWSDPSTPRLGMNSKLWVSSVFTEGGRGHAPQLRGLCPTRWQPFLSGAKRKQIRDKEESTDKTDHHRTPFAFSPQSIALQRQDLLGSGARFA